MCVCVCICVYVCVYMCVCACVCVCVCVFWMFADLSSPSDSSLVTSSFCEANKEAESDVQGVELHKHTPSAFRS